MEMKSKLLITGLAFLALTTLANAQNKTTGQGQQTTPPITRGTYVDANNDGICDNFETTASYNRNGRRMANASATGNRRGMAAGQGRGIARGQGRGMGPGQGRGPGQGGRNFVDADKNGICDFREKPAIK